KVEKTAERIVSQWKELRRDRERLTDDLARFMAENYLAGSEGVSGLKLVSRIVNVKDADVDLLIKTSNELVKRDQSVVSAFICVNKTARLVTMVGEKAQKLGVDAREIAREAATELGGGGSGKADFAQGGGPHIDRAPEALERAKAAIRKKGEG
ncbi:MAG: DHHA1 domain-containing protein, partial [Candidatus Bathyarchaeota archaeon]|nr:DHHA1 domain-containing protein [Candidatus Bathyarchaeota archaeon]